MDIDILILGVARRKMVRMCYYRLYVCDKFTLLH